ncbi:MAG: GNAT family N-acetyltransferase [Clostridia bacterium]|nr:GNAT family N-acetyltransferase [Clostridia bacterium]
MNVTIRRVQAGDENALAYIQTESWKAAFQRILDEATLLRCTNLARAAASYKRLLDEEKGNGYLLLLDGQPHCIAWRDAARDEVFSGKAELICIHSLPRHWRQGFGSMMMDRVLSDAKAAGYSEIILWVFAENGPARRFYEAKGFLPEGREKIGLGAVEMCYIRKL